MNRSEVWARAYSAALLNPNLAGLARDHADTALREFDLRFRGGPDRQDSTAVRSDLVSLLERDFELYRNDPASSRYQKGFLAALLMVADELGIEVAEKNELEDQCIERANPNPTYAVDGHETASPCSSLTVDGQHAPFRIFDTEGQDWLPGLYFFREEAQAIADRLNS
jgi:hypothetical protein